VRVRGAALIVAIVAAAGCSSDDDSGLATSTADVGLVRTVAVPPERLSPFCQAIADLQQRLDEAGPDDDTTELIVDTYSSVVDDVPPDIRDDFLSVLAALQSGTPSGSTTSAPSSIPVSVTGTTVEDFEEGYTPDESAALRVNSYIQFTCRDSGNNPGPSETQPAVGIASTAPS
jgi:hypothetical protein